GGGERRVGRDRGGVLAGAGLEVGEGGVGGGVPVADEVAGGVEVVVVGDVDAVEVDVLVGAVGEGDAVGAAGGDVDHVVGDVAPGRDGAGAAVAEVEVDAVAGADREAVLLDLE